MVSCMISKKNRNSRKDIEQIFKFGRFFVSPNISLKFIKNPNNVKMFSFITPKSVSKKAVIRNLLRRRGYVILKKYLTIIPNGLMGVFVFGKKSAMFFGGRKSKNLKPMNNLENEIKNLVFKLKNEKN